MGMTASGKTATVTLWIATVLETLAMAAAGLAKFVSPDLWTSWFVGWGYPAWMRPTIGSLEILGALLLLVPAAAIGGAGLLIVIMGVALFTVLTNPDTLTWQAPVFHLTLLSVILWLRLARRRAG